MTFNVDKMPHYRPTFYTELIDQPSSQSIDNINLSVKQHAKFANYRPTSMFTLTRLNRKHHLDFYSQMHRNNAYNCPGLFYL